MQRRYEHNFVAILYLIVPFAFQFPVRVIHEYQNARPAGSVPRYSCRPWTAARKHSHRSVLHEQLLPLLQQVVLQPEDEIGEVRRLGASFRSLFLRGGRGSGYVCRNRYAMRALI